jgi:hypothetical protein
MIQNMNEINLDEATQMKILNTRELSNTIEQTLKQNVKLGERDKIHIAKMYDKFRGRIFQAFSANNLTNLGTAFWVVMIGDMMALVKTMDVSGSEKKEILLETMRIVIKYEIAAEKHEILDNMLNTVVSPAIDLAAYFGAQLVPKVKACIFQCFKKK